MNDQSSDAPDLAKVYQFPASFAQRRLWLVDQLAPAGPLYSICRVLLVKGDLDVTALRTSLEQIVARHEVLRTTFDLSEGELVQLIAPEVHLAFESEDLTQLPDSVREPTVHERVQAEFEAPFDLKSGPLFRCRLFRYAADEHVFIINMHHIISDGWSMDVLAKELSTLYGALSRNQTPHLPDLPIQYADYTVWQRDWLSGDTLEKERSYWISQLANVPALELPRDRPRPAGQTFNGGVFRFDISADLATAMLSLGKQERATPFMTLLAVFLVLLHRYSGQQNFCVGSPIANRGKAELEPLIGFFVNTLVIRTHFDENLTFRSFLKAVRETALDAYTHQEFPFEKIVESLNLERDRSRPPVVQVMFSFNEAGYKNLKLGDLQVSSFRTKWIRRTAKFDLTLFVTEHAAGLSLAFEYNTDLFDEATIRRLGEHFQNLIKSIVDDEGRPISGLPILVDEEYRDLVYARNQTATDYPRNADLAALLQAVADCTPDATAVEHNGDTLTYRQLDERANQLARHLLKQGATVQTMIGIYLRPSLDSVVATVAVIKIGAVYVPLDLEYPEDRLKFIIEDVDARLVVTSSDLAGRLPHASVTAICLDRVAQDLVNEAVQRPTSDARPDAVAYVIYTSGSTGTPKGVAVGHRAIARLVLNTDYVQLDKNERIAHISNFAFDAATFELWGALLNGARLVIIDRDVVLSAEEFARELRGKEITTLFLTTALFNVLAQSAPGCFASLKQLMFGGEAADPKWVRRVLADGPPGRLLNVYGPTENTTFSTWYPVTEVGDAEATIPIGRPIANTQVYVLDNSLQPVPVGVPGELYLGGDGLASGYWNRPELTGERFIENPFQTDRGARIYKTGDLVRYRADGNIEFLGRNDNQIKLRGFRIELEEIEARINQHPSVQDNVVLLRKDGRRDPRIVAYAVPMPGEGIEDHELQKFIEEKLPRYMIPAVFISMNALPLNANGKVDRGALPAPVAETRPRSGSAGPIEQQISDIWRDLLDTQEVSTDDNFFELGGHSLLGVRLLFEMEKNLGQRLPLSALFEAPTVAQLASLIRNSVEPNQGSVAAIQVDGAKPPFFCMHGDPSILGPYLEADQPYYFLHCGAGDKRVSYMTVAELAKEHLQEVHEIQPKGPYYLGGFSFGGLLAFEMAQQLVARGESIALLALFDPTSPSVGDKSPAWNIGFHLHEMSKAESYLDRFEYGLRRIAAKANAKYMKARKRIAVLQYRWYLRLDKPIPPSVVFRYNYEMFKRAAKEYTYVTYPGWVTLFQPETGHKRSRHYYEKLRKVWRELTEGRLKFHIVPGTSKHLDLFRKPYVEELARRLTACLIEAQRANHSRSD